MAGIRLALAWLRKRNSKASRYRGWAASPLWKVDQGSAGPWVVRARHGQDGAHTRGDGTGLCSGGSLHTQVSLHKQEERPDWAAAIPCSIFEAFWLKPVFQMRK